MLVDVKELALQARLARRLREVRTARRVSQLDLVRYHGFSLSHYQKLERGVLDPRLSSLKKVADALGMTLSELLAGV